MIHRVIESLIHRVIELFNGLSFVRGPLSITKELARVRVGGQGLLATDN